MDKYTKIASEGLKLRFMGIEFDPEIDEIYATKSLRIESWRSIWGHEFRSSTAGILVIADMKIKGTMRGLFSRGDSYSRGHVILGDYDNRIRFIKEFDDESWYIIRYIETGEDYVLNYISSDKKTKYKRKWSSIEPDQAVDTILNAMVQHGQDWYKNVKG